MKKQMKLKILAWFFPNKCLLCGEHIDALSVICEDCKPAHGTTKNFNVRYRRNSKIVQVYSSALYMDDYAYFIKRYKFNGKTAYARKFIALLKEVFEDFSFENYDQIAYVPMTKDKVKLRGYNQAELLAKELSKLIDIPVFHDLKKIKSNKIQHWLSPKERAENVKGVYDCVSDIKGQNIILIDDIITTGATVCQCVKMLYKAGANNIAVFCLAETPAPTQKEE